MEDLRKWPGSEYRSHTTDVICDLIHRCDGISPEYRRNIVGISPTPVLGREFFHKRPQRAT